MNKGATKDFSPDGERLPEVRQQIEDAVLRHAHFETTRKELVYALEASKLVWLIGPAGVGKGTLVEQLVEEWNEPAANDPWHLPAVSIRAPSSHGPVYPWIAMYTGIDRRLQDPLPAYKVNQAESVERLRNGKISARKGTTDYLRDSVFSAVRDRNVEVLFIDEAINLLANRRGQALVAQLDIIRDLIDGLDCKVILASTPRILDIFEEVRDSNNKGENLTCEIIRRTDKVYFHRYGLRKKTWREEFRKFKKLVQGLFDQLPEAYRLELSSDNLKSLQIDSVGCVGILVKWLIRAMVLCKAEEDERLNWRHFEETTLSDAEWEVLEEQCTRGEEKYAKDQAYSGCGLKRRLKSEPEELAFENGADVSRTDSHKGRQAKQKRIGIPNPSRPPVGRDEN